MKCIHHLVRVSDSEYLLRQNRDKANDDVAVNATSFDSGYGYEDPQEDLRVALMYKSDVTSGRHSNYESPVLYDHVITVLSSLLQQSEIKRVVNFGVCYAYLDSLLAKRFPFVQFVGVDRSMALKKLNETDFPLDNMSFVASDVLEWIESQSDLSDTLFFHMRIAVLLPKKFIDTLYGKLISKKITVIAGFEQSGLSRETNAIYNQSYADKPSVQFRDMMFLHNYAGILSRHGYRLSRLEYIHTAHPDRDFRILSFSAVKSC